MVGSCINDITIGQQLFTFWNRIGAQEDDGMKCGFTFVKRQESHKWLVHRILNCMVCVVKGVPWNPVSVEIADIFRNLYIYDNKDIEQNLRNFRGKLNMLLRKFGSCLYAAKFPLCHIVVPCTRNLFGVTKRQYRQLDTAYNNEFRRLLWVMINTIVLAPCLLKTLLMNSMGV